MIARFHRKVPEQKPIRLPVEGGSSIDGPFYADLHVHSKYSRSTSKDLDLEHLAQWARRKGISVVGTGDFTHPAWRDEIERKLTPAEPGLYRLEDGLPEDPLVSDSPAFSAPVRFLLQVEISTIYKRDGKTRKIHHLLLAPDLEKADRIIDQLNRIGNLSSDGRPILGLDSRDLLEITLESGDGCVLMPAHIWTPWFSLFGSRSGFDDLEHCYGDLSKHIFALETGLSSDPPMNWMCSALDDYTLVSHSDAHSPQKLGREADIFECELDYFEMMEALRSGTGYRGTVEFFPEEGKYHLDGHRKCDVRLDPPDTRLMNGECPVCEQSLTVGVLHRVFELADRERGSRPSGAHPYHSLIPLQEILAEIEDVGPRTITVQRAYNDCLSRVGPELYLLRSAPLEEIRRSGRPMLAEAVRRMREGEVIREPGYDGEYGTIKLFTDREKARDSTGTLFELSEPEPAEGQDSTGDASHSAAGSPRSEPSIQPPDPAEEPSGPEEPAPGILEQLDEDQRRAAGVIEGPLNIVAGPGAGKTRTLTHRIAHMVNQNHASPEDCLAITFTRRAAREMQTRLRTLLPDRGKQIPVMTLHRLGLQILREYHDRAGLPPSFRVIEDARRVELLADVMDISKSEARSRLERLSTRTGSNQRDLEIESLRRTYRSAMEERGWVDFDGLIERPLALLRNHEDVRQSLQDRYRWVCVDEFQDIDRDQYQLIRRLAPPGSNLCVIGDPDQAIYGFRGGDVGLFQRLEEEEPSLRRVNLTTNYRSTRSIVQGALDVVRPDSLVPDRTLRARNASTDPIRIRECSTAAAEAEFVVHTIEQLIGGTTFFSFDSERVHEPQPDPWSFADIGVLYRTDAQTPPLEQAFDRSGIPYQKRTHRSLTEDPAVEQLLEHMDNADPGASLSRQLEDAAQAVTEADDPVPDDHLRRMVEALRPVARRCGSDRDRFRSELAMGIDVDLWDPRADRVSLLTLHAAKGLEFPIVFVVGCENGLIPLQWGGKSSHDRAEERRLLFVGMTRAERRLYLTHARKRTIFGSEGSRSPSPFLDDLDDRWVSRTRATTRGSAPPRSGTETQQTQLL